MAKLFILRDISDTAAIFELLLMAKENPGVAFVPEDVLHAGVRPEVLPDILGVLSVKLSLKLCGRFPPLRVQYAGDRHKP